MNCPHLLNKHTQTPRLFPDFVNASPNQDLLSYLSKSGLTTRCFSIRITLAIIPSNLPSIQPQPLRRLQKAVGGRGGLPRATTMHLSVYEAISAKVTTVSKLFCSFQCLLRLSHVILSTPSGILRFAGIVFSLVGSTFCTLLISLHTIIVLSFQIIFSLTEIALCLAIIIIHLTFISQCPPCIIFRFTLIRLRLLDIIIVLRFQWQKAKQQDYHRH